MIPGHLEASGIEIQGGVGVEAESKRAVFLPRCIRKAADGLSIANAGTESQAFGP